ncbi:MAG TPA: hypothetical protein VHL59_14190, partial [Thermoanaerobaculia bacterium]|nr:hypothetical protein [Thermoanaerobaculia bacterium]
AESPPLHFILIPLVAFSAIAHKELRYLQGIIPFLAILAGTGFAIWRPTRRKLAVALLAISLAWNLWGLRFLGRESRPAVEAARFLGADRSLRTLAIGQLWAYGDRLYLGDDRRVIDIGTPPHDLEAALREADAAALYESDLSPDVNATLARAGFVEQRVFRSPRARDVVVFSAERSAR